MTARPRARRPLPRSEVRALFQRLRRGGDPAAREALILGHESLAVYLARKFGDRGEPLEDLIQVAQIGLIKAIDRYDLSRGIEFTTYVTPTIVGEIKRYFRDKLWSIRVPRRLREVNYALMRAVDELSQRLGRSPTIAELADQTGVPFEIALEALEAGRAYAPASLDAEIAEEGGDHSVPLSEMVGGEDDSLERLEDRATLEWALRKLPDRHQHIVRLRFFDRLSQAEIARQLGISQMHVSRLQREALAQLRALVADQPADGPT